MKKIKYNLVTLLLLSLCQLLFVLSDIYAMPIENILSREMYAPIINNICKKYNRDNLSEYTKLAKKFLNQTLSDNNKTAQSGFIGYVITTLILSNDKIIETTHTIRNDGYELKQQIGPTLKSMIKRGLIDNNYQEAKDYFNNIFIEWAGPYAKERCGFKF